MAEGEDFIVRVTLGQFVQGVDSTTIDVTCVPSYAQFFTYNDAARLSDRLRRRGHPQSCVCDLAGQIMDFDSLEAYQRGLVTSTKASTSDNLPQTLGELNKIPVADQRRRYRSDSRFAARVDQLEGTA